VHFLPEISTIDHFKNSIHLIENVFVSLTEILKNLGKNKFRPILDDTALIDAMFRNAKSENHNRSLSAQTFIVELGKVYGDSIFRALLSLVDE